MAALPFPLPFPAALPALPPQPAGVPFPGDDWPEGPPVQADVERLEAEMGRAFGDNNVPERPGLGQSLALVVVQGGRIVAERYHREVGADDPLISWSMAKSITQSLIGILYEQGRMDLGPANLDGWTSDERAAITVEQLLQMRSGLSWVEEYEPYENGELTDVLEMLLGRGATDMARFAADQALDHRPGEHYYYSSGTSNILAGLLTDAVMKHAAPDSQKEAAALNGDPAIREETMRRFMFGELFDPLGMRSADPRFDQAGTFVGSSFFYATARDYARFGLLNLRDGVWDGRRILPEGWVDAARTAQAVEPDSLNWYGQHWWVYPCSHGSFRASGYEGQAIVVVPGLDLVIVRLGKTPFENGADPLFLHLAEIIACFE